ncbi:LysE family translocator [Salibacterium aidingense]|uniref:LysE family translocator n=1 Tax=Salibacterium aidingense TaxID=384933 RepID=UPI003BBBBAC8
MDFVVLTAFLGTAVAVTLAPGPDILFVTAQSIARRAKAGIVTACGLCTGLLVHITAAAAGVSAVIYQSSLAFSIVKYAGALYLLYLAWQAFRNRDTASWTNQEKTDLPYAGLYKKGILMNLLNPKVSLFFLALLPQFTNTSSGPVALQMLLLGMLFLLQAFIIFSVVSLLAHQAGRILQNNPKVSRRMNLVQGTLFTVIGLQMVVMEK